MKLFTGIHGETEDFQSQTGTSHIAFLNICIGGVGTQAGAHILSRFRSDEQPFPMGLFHLDTDPGTTLDTEDRALIQLTGADVRAIRANPKMFWTRGDDHHSGVGADAWRRRHHEWLADDPSLNAVGFYLSRGPALSDAAEP